jgi:hypothetical protein
VVTTGAAYSLVAQDQNGCTNWDTIYVGFRYEPRADFGPDTTLCANQSLVLHLEPGSNPYTLPNAYLWQNGTTKDSFMVTQQGTYWGQSTYQGCTVSDTINVSYVNAAGVSLGADTSLCIGDSLRLKPNLLNAAYLWSTGETTQNIVVRTVGDYWVRVNNGSCTVMDTIHVRFEPKPGVFLGNDTLICEKEKIMLTASVPGASYLWNDASVKSTFDVSKPGLYWVNATVNGCSNSDSISVSFKPLPNLNLGKDTGLCVQQILLLNAADPAIRSYLWQDGSSLGTYLVNGPGEYRVSVTGTNGCINKDTISVAYSPVPNFSLGNDTTLCTQQKLPITFSLPNAIYTWSTGDHTNGYTISQPGLYWLTISQNGCSKTDSVRVNYKPLPDIHLGNDTTLCEGFTKTLDATYPGATYQWQDMSAGGNFQVRSPGLYYATVTLDGCSKKDSIQILYKYKPRLR